MQRIITWMCICACAAWGAARGELRCVEPMEKCERVGGKEQSSNEDQFTVEGKSIIVSYKDSRYLVLTCNRWEVLDSTALPCFTSEFRVPSVTLHKCPPPAAGGSFADTLAKLNVTLQRSATQGKLTLMNLPSRPPLTATHFSSLEDLVKLELVGTSKCSINHFSECPSPVAGFLSGLQRQRSLNGTTTAPSKLQSLDVSRVRLPPGELENLPESLQILILQKTGAERLPHRVLELPDLQKLELIEEKLTIFAMPPTLRTLYLESDNTTFSMESIAALEELKLVKWSEKRPKALTQCSALQSLLLLSPSVEALPERWVAPCAHLERLEITNFGLTSLPSKLLENATSLIRLSLTKGQLATLPLGLFDDVSNLRTLDLTENKLAILPSNLFASTRQLKTLRLSKNLITADDVKALAELTSLETLKLDKNPHLGDLCGIVGTGYSPLLNLTELESLSLVKTNITRICRDWRENLTSLQTVNLQSTAISVLGFSDVQLWGDSVSSVNVLLEGAPVVSIRYTEDEYNKSQSLALSRAAIQLDTNTSLKCDCHMYWTRLALYSRNRRPLVKGLRCNAERAPALQQVPLDEMVCREGEMCRKAQVPDACSCTERPDSGGRTLVRVHCEGVGRRTVPTLRAIVNVIYDLLLANNNISNVSIGDLPSSWRVFDIRNNSLKRLDNDTAWELVRSPHRLLIAGNPIECDCSAAPLLLALHSAGNNASDFLNAFCAGGGGMLQKAATVPCASMPLVAWLTGALSALLLITAAVVSYLAPLKRRVLFKLILHNLGLLPLPPDPPAPQGGFRFDAFICFPPEDEEIVVLLIQELKGCSAPYRLCLEGDWMAGSLISDQIKESMRVSRRTVVLVSQAYFHCDWTQAAFRAAYALTLSEATPRLVLILLDDPKQLPFDEDMQRYISNNTYVRWGESWFWKQLRLALGTPLAQPAPIV